MLAAQIVSQVVSIGTLAVLARLLGIEPYGLFGMVMPLVALARIVTTLGLDVTTVQQSELSDQQVSALFWVNQFLGLATAGLMAVCAPLVARFYAVPDVAWVTVAMAGTSVPFVLGTQHLALMQRRFRLGTVAAVRLAALVVASSAGIALALAGAGVWALVAQQYAELLALAVLAWILEPWRPHFVLRGLGARRLVRFGGHFGIGSLMFYVVSNADKILIGYWFKDGRPVALYSQAFNLMMKPVHVLVTPLTSVMLPTLTRAAGRPQYADLLHGFTRFISLVMLPAGVGLAIVAPEAMRVVCGPEWAEAGPILSVLAVTLVVQGFFNSSWTILASTGHAARFSAASTAIAIVLGAAYFVGIQLGDRAGDGLMGLAVTYTFALALLVFPLYLAVCLRTANVSMFSWLKQVLPASRAALVMGIAVGLCHWLLGSKFPLPDLPLLAIEVLLGGGVYIALSWREIRQFIRR